jgi:hypothetical protein
VPFEGLYALATCYIPYLQFITYANIRDVICEGINFVTRPSRRTWPTTSKIHKLFIEYWTDKYNTANYGLLVTKEDYTQGQAWTLKKAGV